MIAGSGRSPGEENGNPLQYSCLENSMHRGAWWATVHGKAWDSQQREEVCCVLGFSPGQSLPALDQPLLSLLPAFQWQQLPYWGTCHYMPKHCAMRLILLSHLISEQPPLVGLQDPITERNQGVTYPGHKLTSGCGLRPGCLRGLCSSQHRRPSSAYSNQNSLL